MQERVDDDAPEIKWVMTLRGNPGTCQDPAERRWEVSVGLKDFGIPPERGSWKDQEQRLERR